jgi:hypothetical protein
MVLEGKLKAKAIEGATFGFIQKATPEQLLAIAAGTSLSVDPLFTNFNNPHAPAFFQKTEDLRGRIAKNFRRHADFRGMVIRAVAPMQISDLPPEAGGGSTGPKSGDGKPKKGKA